MCLGVPATVTPAASKASDLLSSFGLPVGLLFELSEMKTEDRERTLCALERAAKNFAQPSILKTTVAKVFARSQDILDAKSAVTKPHKRNIEVVSLSALC